MVQESAKNNEKLWAVILPEGFESEGVNEFKWKKLEPLAWFDRFFLFKGEPKPIAWAQVTWKNVERLPIASIGDGVKKIKPIAKKWVLFPTQNRRRSTLIFEQLRAWKEPIIHFPEPFPASEAGAFTMLEENEILYCKDFDRPHPLGLMPFEEDKIGSPSRAYLKLWEAFTVLKEMPEKKELCVDLGSSPGGWTWVLAELGARTISVDKALLDPKVASRPEVEYRKGDAFSIEPGELGKVDWLFSDVICYPHKLLEFLQPWIERKAAKHFICTIKFQGKANPAVIEKFEALGKVMHLHHNKHELTWIR